MRDKSIRVSFTVMLDRKNEILPIDENGDVYSKWVMEQAFRLVEKSMKGEGSVGVGILDVTPSKDVKP